MPREHGIYALYDHSGCGRYVGITQRDRLGLYGRINQRHVSGSETRSHKFSHAYNTGRMWRDKTDTGADAMLAKALRRAFIRRYCRATFLIIPPLGLPALVKLESAVKEIAPEEMRAWDGTRGFPALPEPKALVDELLKDLRFSVVQTAAVERQASRHIPA